MSGMPRFPYNVDPKDLDKPYIDYTVTKLYQYVSKFEPPYDIDSKWRYSNVGYGLLGNIPSLVAKKDFETLLTEKICKPLNMNNTTISLTATQKSNLAVWHAETGAPVGLTDLGAIDAGGALRSNVNDLLTFAEANMGLTRSGLLPAMELTHVCGQKKTGMILTLPWVGPSRMRVYSLKMAECPGIAAFWG
jgi:D-alanyl-D-alanine-carboxypeptidase/D-alanyl-D-alanine-endopeptidase